VSSREEGPLLVLASGSPRRAELLTLLGLRFEVVRPRVPEDGLDGESSREHVERLAREKALEVVALRPDAFVVAGDTEVVRDGIILGKPRDPDDALAMLLSLAGRAHQVVSGVALAFPDGSLRSGVSVTEVEFRSFGEELARRYVETGEPMDKAGAYGIQGLGGVLVRRIRGDYHTVVGLALPLLLDLLEEGGWRYEFGTLVPFRRGSFGGGNERNAHGL
jgi:septum formation protein